MASKDHYVSQTYLRLFIGPNGDLVPYYKNARVIVGKSKSPKLYVWGHLFYCRSLMFIRLWRNGAV